MRWNTIRVNNPAGDLFDIIEWLKTRPCESDTDPRSLVAAEYIVVATSLPAEDFPAGEVLAAYRLRW